jgi:hypothetical protein
MLKMLNVYSYHTDPKSLAAPSDAIMQRIKDGHYQHLDRFLDNLDDDFNVRVSKTIKPTGAVWYTVSLNEDSYFPPKRSDGTYRVDKWGKDDKLTFYMPEDSTQVCEIDSNHQITNTYNNVDDFISMLADELTSIGAAHPGR